MNTINVENCKTLLIGRRGENEVTTVAFDFAEWQTEFGSGVVDLYVKRFGDESAYPVVLTIDGTVASWLVTETDTNVAGYGKAEYVYRVDGKIAKSAVFPFFVAEDIGQPASEPPDPYESWLEQLTALGAETEAHAQAAEQSAEDAAESAEDAAQSATSAEGYAGQAETAAGLAQAAQTASEAARDAAQTAQASAEASATAAQTAQSAAEDAQAAAEQAAQQAHVEYEQLSGEVDDLSDEVSQQKSALNILDPLVEGSLVSKSASGNPVQITDAMRGQIAGLVVDIVPNQSGSGDASPANVRPINDITAVGITVNNDTTSISLDTSTASITGKRLGHVIVDKDGNTKFRAEYAIRKLTSFDGAWGSVPSGYAVYYYANSITNVGMDSKFMASSAFVFSNAANENYMPALSYGGRSGAATVYTFILPSTVTSLASAREWLSTNFPNGIQYIAKLSTPVEYNLQDVSLTLVDGTNAISSDSGAVDLTYYAKLESVLDGKADQNDVDNIESTIANMQNDIRPDINHYSGVDNGWVIGTINNDGSEGGVGQNGRIRSGFIYLGKGSTIKNTNPSSYYHDICYYTLDKTYISRTDWITTPVTISEDCFVRIVMAKNVSGAITPEEISVISNAEEISRIFPQTELSGRAITQEEFSDNAYIPAYFENQVKNAIANAEQKIASAGFDGDNFAFISDLHWYKNKKKSPMLMRRVLEKINCNKIICGGDLIGGGSKNSEIAEMRDCVAAFKNTAPFYVLFGNHDSNHMNAPSSADYFTRSEFYAIAQKQVDNAVEYAAPNYFYFDNRATKTRFICLDTGEDGVVSSTQRSWFEIALNSVSANWHIIVFAHILYSESSWFVGMTLSDCTITSSAEYIYSTIDNFNANNQDKKVEAIFGGHLHFDAESQTTGGVPVILIDTDSIMTYSSERATVGTTTEQCFDIVCIDYDERSINCVRIGRGGNRTITY